MNATGAKLCYLKALLQHPPMTAQQSIFVNFSQAGNKMLLNITLFPPDLSQRRSPLTGFNQAGRAQSLLNNFSHYCFPRGTYLSTGVPASQSTPCAKSHMLEQDVTLQPTPGVWQKVIRGVTMYQRFWWWNPRSLNASGASITSKTACEDVIFKGGGQQHKTGRVSWSDKLQRGSWAPLLGKMMEKLTFGWRGIHTASKLWCEIQVNPLPLLSSSPLTLKQHQSYLLVVLKWLCFSHHRGRSFGPPDSYTYIPLEISINISAGYRCD